MSILAKVLGKYGAGHQLTHDGTTFTFKAIGQKDKDALASAYYKRARQAVHETKDEVSEDKYNADLKECRKDYTSGEYAFPDKTMGHYLTVGLSTLVCVLTGCSPEQADALVTHRADEVMEVCLCVVMDSFPNLKARLLQAEESGKLPAEALAMLQQLTSA